jgi:tRNA threonylcarbamoyladenosine biosynthesis protein TsaE
MERIFTLSTLGALAVEFWSVYANKKVFAIGGKMGVGKTTFIQALCKAKKVEDLVGSPTFSLINEYRFPEGIIYHLDLYRLKDEEEAIRAGIEDCLYSGEICLVEWPERAPGIFPPDTLHLLIEELDEMKRKIKVTLS